MNYLDNYEVLKETTIKINLEKKYFYEYDDYVLINNKNLKIQNCGICKTCKGFGWILDNSKKNSLSNQINYKLCPDCN